MSSSERKSLLGRLIYRFIQRPLLDLRERWLAYFSRFSLTEGSYSSRQADVYDSPQLRKPSKISVALSTSATEIPSDNRCGKLISMISISLGMGQLWRFPNLAYKSGGGAFVIASVVFTMLIGYGLYVLESISGQYSSKTPLRVHDRTPLFQGIGLSMILYSNVLIVYYTQMAGIGIQYFVSSFDFNLPWLSCPENITDLTSECYSPESYSFYVNYSCPETKSEIRFHKWRLCNDGKYQEVMMEKCCKKDTNCSEFHLHKNCKKVFLPQASYYWNRTVIRYYDINDSNHGYLGEFNLKSLLSGFGAWFFVYLFVTLGLKWSGLTTIFALLLLYPTLVVILLSMFADKETSEGTILGLKNLFVPTLASLKNTQVWLLAAEQSFFSLGVAMGPVIMIGAQTSFRKTCYLDAFYVCLLALSTSILASTVVFASIGRTARSTGIPFDCVFPQGFGTSLIAYSESFAELSIPWAASALFFFSFLMLGITTVSGLVIMIAQCIQDAFHYIGRDNYFVHLLVIFGALLLGVVIDTRGGAYLFEALDQIPGGLALVAIAILELVAVTWVYTLGLFSEDIAFMFRQYPNRFFRYVWLFSPLILIGIAIYAAIFMTFPPEWSLSVLIMAWLVFALVLLPVPFTMIWKLCKCIKTGNWQDLVTPPKDHGPKLEEQRNDRKEYVTSRKVL